MSTQNSLSKHPNCIGYMDNLYIFDIDRNDPKFPINQHTDKYCLHSIISHTAECSYISCVACPISPKKTRLLHCDGADTTKFIIDKYFPKLKDTNPEYFI